MDQERVRDFVTLTTESFADPQHTTWAGHSIIWNFNPWWKSRLTECCYADLSMARSIGRKEYLEEDVGSIDGDEYLRLLSLYKIRSNEWLKQSFDKFEAGITFNDDRIIQPSSITEKRTEYEDLEDWQKLMADRKFKGMFNSEKAKKRFLAKTRKKPGPGSGKGKSDGKGGPKPGTGGGGTGKSKSKPALGHKTTLDVYK